MADFTIKKGDRLPAFKVTLKENGVAFNLTGYTVKFLMKVQGGGSPKVNTAATVTSASAGEVEYQWGASDTDTAGIYDAEWEATETATTKKITFPNDTYMSVSVVTDIA